MRRRFVALTFVFTSLLCTSCAQTTIERTPDGSFRYYSTRDSQLDALTLARDADGAIELTVNGASGSASPVIQSQAALLEALLEAAFTAGARSVTGR
ncbi:MAG: hypothetical protein ACR2GY_12150 [Phycisphaerales bacterium]